MSDYKQFRADFAKSAWIKHMDDWDHEEAAQRAVLWADTFIAELERTEAKTTSPLTEQFKEHIIAQMTAGVVSIEDFMQRPQPAPALPRLNTGWKWAEVNKHTITSYDVWVHSNGQLQDNQDMNVVGTVLRIPSPPLATPDWHNPEGIASPGEGYRFLVKGEKLQIGDQFYLFQKKEWGPNHGPSQRDGDWWTHRTPATRPLPPVLAQPES